MRNKAVFFGVLSLLLLFTILNDSWEGSLVMVSIMLLGVMILLFPTTYVEEEETTGATAEEEIPAPCLSYHGDELHFTDDILTPVLTKHFPYFTTLNFPEKQKFLQRLKKFIAIKTFRIHDESGFREMPVLISATAIQLTFGLEKYLLPYYECINIYPEEFLGIHPTIRFLEGNVSGRTINISWKHFLAGFRYPHDGQNVGLHELAHAYYYQNFETGNNTDSDFVHSFNKFNHTGNKVFEAEQVPGNDLYSDYAMKNFQEFWAESVEIFFEKPVILKASYPELYAAISDLLNQDPAARQLPY